jgi:acyl carrier protein
MLDHRMNSATDRITVLVKRILRGRPLRVPASADADLRSAGLSSLDMVNLVLAVESEFGVSVPDADITPAQFRSIASITALVTTLMSTQELI